MKVKWFSCTIGAMGLLASELQIRKVIEATRKVAAGDFSVQVQLKGIQELENYRRASTK